MLVTLGTSQKKQGFTDEEKKKVEEFLKKKGVTKCPGMFTKELGKHMAERDAAEAEKAKAFQKSWRHNKAKRAGL